MYAGTNTEKIYQVQEIFRSLRLRYTKMRCMNVRISACNCHSLSGKAIRRDDRIFDREIELLSGSVRNGREKTQRQKR